MKVVYGHTNRLWLWAHPHTRDGLGSVAKTVCFEHCIQTWVFWVGQLGCLVVGTVWAGSSCILAGALDGLGGSRRV